MKSFETTVGLSLAVLLGLGTAACGGKNNEAQHTSTTPRATPSATITGEAAQLITGTVCSSQFRDSDGECTKGGLKVQDVMVCSLSDSAVVIVKPAELQGEVPIGGNVGEILEKENKEQFIPCP